MKKRFLRPVPVLSTLAVLALSACGDADEGVVVSPPPIQAPQVTNRRLVPRGTALYDELGRQVILRGVNVGGRSKMPPFLPFEIASDDDVKPKAADIMSRVKKLGANGIRLTFSWEGLEPSRGAVDAQYLARYKALLDAAESAGLAAIIDFHQDVFHAAFCGDGFPEWALGDIPHGQPHYDCSSNWSTPYFLPTSDVNRAFDRVWDNVDGLQDDFVGMWARMAKEIGKHPAVAMFEIINEPGPGSRSGDATGTTILPALYDRVAAAIEAEAGAAGVIGDEPMALPMDIGRLARPTHPHFVYGPHYYDVLTTLGLPADPERIRAEVLAVLSRADAYGVPVVLGEFGASNTAIGKNDFLSAVLDAADAHRSSAMVWEGSISNVQWNSEDLSVFLEDGSARDWGRLLDRPYPRAVDGTVIDFRWEANIPKVTLAVEGQGDKVSQIYLPYRVFGSNPHVVVTGARSRFDVATSELLVVAEPGASWSLIADAPF